MLRRAAELFRRARRRDRGVGGARVRRHPRSGPAGVARLRRGVPRSRRAGHRSPRRAPALAAAPRQPRASAAGRGGGASSRRSTSRWSSPCGPSRRRWPSATPSSSSRTCARASAAVSSWPGSSKRPACPAGSSTCCPAASTSAPRLIDDPRVRVVSFTGSTQAGRAIGARAAESLTRAHLELGGNNALIVLGDADLEAGRLVRRVRQLHQLRPGVHGRRATPRPRGPLRRLRRDARQDRRRRSPSATASARTSRSARSSTRSS